LTLRRACVLLAVFAAVALSVVHLRAEQTRSAARVLKIESDWVRLRGDLWSLQIRNARMRAPDRIHDRATYLATGVVPPGPHAENSQRRLERVAASQPPGMRKRLTATSSNTDPHDRDVATRE